MQCAKCGSDNPAGNKFCGQCGAPLAEVQSASRREGTEGERKTVTALFADIKGSTALMANLDPEQAREIIDPALRRMIDAVHRYEGYVVQSTGDGIFALFGAPLAHEDHPQRALYAALEMQQALREYAEQQARGLEVRIGVNTGEVVVRHIETSGRTEYTPIGHTANLASRMESVAPPGSIAIGEQTRSLVEGYFELRALGPTTVKGISGEVNVYEVTGVGPLRTHFELSARRGLTRFVGRDPEIAEMLRGLELARGGQGQVVAAVAEAGAGKSRLIHEFKALIAGRAKVLEAYSVSHGKASPWLPVLELLKPYFGITELDGEPEVGKKIADGVRGLDPALEDTIVYLQRLLGVRAAAASLAEMDFRLRHQRTLAAITRLIVGESQREPLVVIFEDLHWIDEDTGAFLNVLVDSIARARVLLMLNYRPEYRDHWSDRSHYQQIRLEPLDESSAGEMVSALLGDSEELAPLRTLVIDKTDGNPFFIEELVQALFEQGALRRNGVLHLARPLGALGIPATVQGILASRIDRLPAAEKELIGALAVLGKDFAHNLVRHLVTASESELNRMLVDLERADFIYEQPGPADRHYSFKHALTQEVAYGEMLLGWRRRLHSRAAAAIEAVHGERLNQHYAELIRHYTIAGDNPKALGYIDLAVKQDFELSAYPNVLKLCAAALDLTKGLPEGPERTQAELGFNNSLALAMLTAKGIRSDEFLAAVTRLVELSQGDENGTTYMNALNLLNDCYLGRWELQKAGDVAERYLAIAERAGDRFQQILALIKLAARLKYAGEFSKARERIERAHALCGALGIENEPVTDIVEYGTLYKPFNLRALRALFVLPEPEVLWYLGYPDQADETSRQAVAWGEATGAHWLGWALVNTSRMHAARRDWQVVKERIERLETLANRYGLDPSFVPFARQMRAALLVEDGRPQDAIAIMLKEPGAQSNLLLLQAYARAGQVEAALSAIQSAIEISLAPECHDFDAEKHRLKGEILLLQRDPDQGQAERCLRTAIEIARHQNAKSWELRAATSLAALLDKQGKRDEARTMLKEIYGWFTEGFDTADLKEAKALLDQLSR